MFFNLCFEENFFYELFMRVRDKDNNIVDIVLFIQRTLTYNKQIILLVFYFGKCFSCRYIKNINCSFFLLVTIKQISK